MNVKEYQKLAKRTIKPFKTSAEELSSWGLGISGEAGDVAGCIKKTLYHKNNQIGGIRENLGDVMWYISAICNFFGWQLEDILDENIEKLKKRYPEGFTEKDAARDGTRVDWNEKDK